jgi:tRNA-specific adenosine deaminase 1
MNSSQGWDLIYSLQLTRNLVVYRSSRVEISSKHVLTPSRTGMKCLPSNKLPQAHGDILHDWHAEVVAIRAFNLFLLDQCLSISTAPFLTQPFAISDEVAIYMYCSEAPCGDASMELVMSAQEDATPWNTPAPAVTSSSSLSSPQLRSRNNDEKELSALRGRSNFSILGAVRCKPSRPDAPPTLSKSCTDKLALKQGTSLLSSTTSLLISPKNAYLHSVILPDSQYVPDACSRAFSRSGRLKHLSDEMVKSWKGGYKWQSFDVKSTRREFEWSRRAVAKGEKAVPSNLSAVWTPAWQETLIGGVLQGRKQFDPRGASAICRRGMWKMVIEIAAVASIPMFGEVLGKRTYKEVKEDSMFMERKRVKTDITTSGLRGWVKNTGDEEWGLEDETTKA